MTLKRNRGWALVGAVLSCLVAGSAGAGVLAQSDFGGRPSLVENAGGIELETQRGTGWHSARVGSGDVSGGALVVELSKSGLPLGRGALDFTLVRNNREDEETVFTLVGKDEQEPLFHLNIDWARNQILSGGLLTNETAFTSWVETNGLDYWAHWVSLPTGIGRGEEFRLTVTWGPSPSDNGLYLNGNRMKATLTKAFDLAGIIQRSTKLVIGEEIGPPVDGTHGGYHNQLASTLLDFKLLDTPTAAEAEPVAIASVSHEVFRAAGFSGKLVAGNTAQMLMTGTPGVSATFDVARLANFDRTIALDWKGYGVYLEEKSFFAESEVDLAQVEGYRVYASLTPFSAPTAEMVPVETLELDQQSYLLENLDLDVPYYVGVFAEMRDGSLRPVIAPRVGLSMTETAPGTYTGQFKVGETENYEKAVLVGHLARGAEAATLAATPEFGIDTTTKVQVSATPQELKADEKSTAGVTVTVTDANGNAVPGRKVKFVLATTSQYTGVVGGGAFADQVGGSIAETTWSETDLFGKVTAKYVAGFAAKTAIIVARDMASNSTGSAFVKTFIQSAAELELLPAEPPAAADAGYEISVTSSDEWLTADGKSQARITAKVTLNGNPVEGHNVSFNVSSGTGSVRTVRGTTGRDGEARALYTAGTKIGLVLVTATDTTLGLSGSVQIELRSDAPAKIAINLDPEKIPADGRSTSTLLVTVTDINDNPNENTEVEYRIASGGGRLAEDRGLTDRRGESAVEYRAGRNPGRVSIEITVRSTVPTDGEMAEARDLAVLPSANKYF